MQNPLFSCVGLQMVMMFLHASFAGNKKISGNAGDGAKQIMNTYLKDTLRNFRSDQIGCSSVSTCAQADVTVRKGGDGFLRGVHACESTDFYTCCSFWRENPRWRISPPLVFGDGFLRGARAYRRRPSGRLCFTKSQWDRSLGHDLLFKPMLPAKIQTDATSLTITILVYHPHPHWQHHGVVTCNLESAVCVAMLDWFLIGARQMAWRVNQGLSRWQNQTLRQWRMSWKTHKDMPVPRSFSMAGAQAMTEKNSVTDQTFVESRP